MDSMAMLELFRGSTWSEQPTSQVMAEMIVEDDPARTSGYDSVQIVPDQRRSLPDTAVVRLSTASYESPCEDVFLRGSW